MSILPEVWGQSMCTGKPETAALSETHSCDNAKDKRYQLNHNPRQVRRQLLMLEPLQLQLSSLQPHVQRAQSIVLCQGRHHLRPLYPADHCLGE